MRKPRKKIKVRDQKPLKDVKGGGHHHHDRTHTRGVKGEREDPPNLRHL